MEINNIGPKLQIDDHIGKFIRFISKWGQYAHPHGGDLFDIRQRLLSALKEVFKKKVASEVERRLSIQREQERARKVASFHQALRDAQIDKANKEAREATLLREEARKKAYNERLDAAIKRGPAVVRSRRPQLAPDLPVADENATLMQDIQRKQAYQDRLDAAISRGPAAPLGRLSPAELSEIEAARRSSPRGEPLSGVPNTTDGRNIGTSLEPTEQDASQGRDLNDDLISQATVALPPPLPRAQPQPSDQSMSPWRRLFSVFSKR